MPSFCTPDTSPGHLAEVGLFFIGGMAISALASPEVIGAALDKIGIGSAATTTIGACADGKCTNEAATISARLAELLQKIKGVNPSGGNYNCVNCAIATDATLGGVPKIAENGGRLSNSQVTALLQKLYGATVDIFANRTTSGQIVDQLTTAGPGARGIVLGDNLVTLSGHAFNAINYQGTVFFIDGQHVEAVDTAIYQVLYFLQTH